MNGASLHLIKIFGIPIRIHASWLIIFALVMFTLGAIYFPQTYPNWPSSLHWIIGFVTSLLFFCSVLVHELAHSLVAVQRGMKVRDIVLFVFGGVSELGDEPESAATEYYMALVGPLTSFALAVVATAAWYALRDVSEPVAAVCFYMALINCGLAAFNMIPGFPLDGGRVFRSVMWGITGDLDKSTRWAARLGIAIAWALMGLGLLTLISGRVGGLWPMLVGWFLKTAAQGSYDRTRLKRALQGVPVRQVMSVDCAAVAPEANVGAVVHDMILGRGARCVPVTQDDRLAGLITVHMARAVPQEHWESLRAGEVMIPADKVKTVGPNDDLWAAMEEMTEEGVNQLPVVDGDRLVGIVGRDAVMGYLRMKAELGL